eukprot:sb/3472466/
MVWLCCGCDGMEMKEELKTRALGICSACQTQKTKFKCVRQGVLASRSRLFSLRTFSSASINGRYPSKIQRLTTSLLLHKTFNSRFVDSTKGMNNTHCGAQLLADSTSYYHLKSLWAPYRHSDPDLVTSSGERVLVTKSGWALNRGQIPFISYIGGIYPVTKSGCH